MFNIIFRFEQPRRSWKRRYLKVLFALGDPRRLLCEFFCETGISKNCCATNSGSPEVELRFCQRLILFKCCTELFSISLLCVCIGGCGLRSINEWEPWAEAQLKPQAKPRCLRSNFFPRSSRPSKETLWTYIPFLRSDVSLFEDWILVAPTQPSLLQMYVTF